MQIKLYGLIRQAAGVKIIEKEAHPGLTVRDVLAELTQQYPMLVKYIWKESGELSELAHVFINGENLRHLSGPDTILKPEDHVDIFPPVVGG
ncbi:MAG TPA: ubiquitin-like small modifier protein 1 [Anaerolineales bacterium]|nr:ubiquitin-like small modifier protein 1 [Anaerolineales bacterium]